MIKWFDIFKRNTINEGRYVPIKKSEAEKFYYDLLSNSQHIFIDADNAAREYYKDLYEKKYLEKLEKLVIDRYDQIYLKGFEAGRSKVND